MRESFKVRKLQSFKVSGENIIENYFGCLLELRIKLMSLN